MRDFSSLSIRKLVGVFSSQNILSPNGHAKWGAVEEIGLGYIAIPRSLLRGYPEDECSVLRVKGSSMYPKMIEGDVVIIHIQDTVESGECAVVLNGDEGTIKTVRYNEQHRWIDLIPANPEYETKRIQGRESERVHIFGKVLASYREY